MGRRKGEGVERWKGEMDGQEEGSEGCAGGREREMDKRKGGHEGQEGTAGIHLYFSLDPFIYIYIYMSIP